MSKNTVRKMTKPASLVFCGLGYLVALIVAAAAVMVLRGLPVMLAVFIADIAATIVIFAFSVASDNSSFYDPYWSVAPVPVILLLAFSREGFDIRGIIVLVVVTVWAARLTWNWMRRWRGFGDEDFRYSDFRKTSGRLYWLVSFFGFHFFPTIIVFLGMLPLFGVYGKRANPFDIADVAAILVAAAAILVESVSDEQLWRFRKAGGKKGRILDKGLWSWSRHPNYFGEILFWCGIFVFGVASGSFSAWLLAGPVAMILLFAFVSVPLADRRMTIGRPAYKERMASVSGLVPLPPQHLRDGETVIPLLKKPIDVIILCYLLFNFIFVSYVISIEQIVIPGPVSLSPRNFTYPAWPPQACVDIVHWWEGNFDPLLLARPVWYKATIWIDVVLFGPFTIVAAYAFIRRRNWIRIPAIVYSAIMFTNVTIILSEEIWGPHAAVNPLIPVLANASWFVFPFIIIARMCKNDHPFTRLKEKK